MRILICEEMHFKKFKFPDWKYAHARFGVLCSVSVMKSVIQSICFYKLPII